MPRLSPRFRLSACVLMAVALSPAALAQQAEQGKADAVVYGLSNPDMPKAIADKLDKKIDLQLIDTPLIRALEFIKSESDLSMIVRGKQLATQVPITVRGNGLEVRAVLDMLRQFTNIDYIVRDGVLYVSSVEDIISERNVNRVYEISAIVDSVPDFTDSPEVTIHSGIRPRFHGGGGGGAPLFGGGGFGGDDAMDTRAEELVDLIQSAIFSDFWGKAGCSISQNGNVLVVIAPPEVQDEIDDLLSRIEEGYGKTIAVEAELYIVSRAVMQELITREDGGRRLIIPANGVKAVRDKLGEQAVPIGSGRLACFNMQRVWSAIGIEQAHLADLQPIVAEGTSVFDPTLGSVFQGFVLDVVPSADRKNRYTKTTLRATLATDAQIRTLRSKLLGEPMLSPSPDIDATTDIKITPEGKEVSRSDRPSPESLGDALLSQRANQPTDNQKPADADDPRADREGNSTAIELPSIGTWAAKTTLRIPNGGAAILTGSAIGSGIATGEQELILLLQVTIQDLDNDE